MGQHSGDIAGTIKRARGDLFPAESRLPRLAPDPPQPHAVGFGLDGVPPSMRERRLELVLGHGRLVVSPEQLQFPLVPVALGHASAAVRLPLPLKAKRAGMALDAGPRSLRQALEEVRRWRVVEVFSQRLLFLSRPACSLVHEGAMDDDLLDPTGPPDELAPDPFAIVADVDPVECDACEELAMQFGREPRPLGSDVREKPSHSPDIVGGESRPSCAARAVTIPQLALLLGDRVLQVGVALGGVLCRTEECSAVRLQRGDLLFKTPSAAVARGRLGPMLLVLGLQMLQHRRGLVWIGALAGDELGDRPFEDVGRNR